MIHWLLQSLDDCPEILRGNVTPVWLNAAEQARLHGFKVEKRRRDWLLGRWTAKNLVQRYLAGHAGQAPGLESIFIGADTDGAPYASCEGRLPVSLSISHSHGTAFCGLVEAFSAQRRNDTDVQDNRPSLGCDIELIEPREGNFLDSFFTVEEMTAVRRLREQDPAASDILTTAIWSGKEAVLKALREGLRIDTRRITCQFDPFVAPPQEWTPFTVNVDDELDRQFSGAWSGWWHIKDRFALTMALLEEAKHIIKTQSSQDSVRS